MVFALSALALLATTLWMVIADYAQPWKRFQSEFRSLERQKLIQEAEAERARISDNELAQLRQEIEQAEKSLASQQDEIRKLEEEIRQLDSDDYTAEATWRGAKAVLDERRFLYDEALQEAGHGESERERETEETAERRKAWEEAREELRKAKAHLDRVRETRAAKQARLAELQAAKTQAEEKLAALRSGVESLETRIANLDKDIDYFVLNAPLMDFVLPTLKVEQVILPGLYHNINFTNINRVDRCMTCHAAANRPGFEGEEWKEPYRSHPKLDLFVGDGSPHPYTQFGCTVCHGGLDRATDFARAGHSPRTKEQEEEWIEKYGWKPQPYLEYPILPAGMSEAGCASCHAGGAWTPQAEVQDVGRELIYHMGCNGCHTINYPAYQNLRKAGPALTRIAGKTNPGWAYRWIESPRDFHPTTWMPHFFYQENTQLPVNKKRQQTEISAIVSYLWAKSERPAYPPAPPGDPARGKQIFDTVGCAGCHIIDAKAKRDDYFPVVNRLHGPNLIRTGSKVDSGWLYAWVRNPKQYFPDTNMPDLRLTDQEAADVVAYLLSSRDPRFENVRVPAPDKTERDNLVREYLQNLYSADRAAAMLQGMSDQQRNVYLGEQTIAKYGCYGCHDIQGFENMKPIGTELTQEGSKPLHQFDFGHVHDVGHSRHAWIKMKVMRPRIWDQGKEPAKEYNELLKMPDFGMSEREAQAVTANVLGFTRETAIATRKAGANSNGRLASVAEGRKLITRFNCQGCHLIEGQGHAIKSLIQDVAMLPPNLAAEGARVQADWLFDYLHDPSQVRMRPWLTVRMPTFGFTDQQKNALVGYFAARDQRELLAGAPGPADPRSLGVGRVVFDMLQCAKCHPSGPVPQGTGVTADLAPSLLLAQNRLRHDWVPDWIKDPQKWIPGTRMPSNFPEEEPGKYTSPIVMVVDAPAYAQFKQRMLPYFASEAELKAFLSDVDNVTIALRDHIWSLSGGGRRPAFGNPAGGGAEATAGVVAGAAGGR